MRYLELYEHLKRNISFNQDRISINEYAEVVNIDYKSENYFILPGADTYICKSHNFQTKKICNEYYNLKYDGMKIYSHDADIEENLHFKIQLLKPKKVEKVKDMILLFHGFNEKDWDKYYPWAYKLMELTGKSVLLFPIAFHINRAPKEWSNRRLMVKLSDERKEQYPEIISSTIINSAISTRLSINPMRFIWSGLQSYYDIIDFIENIKKGKYDSISEDVEIDFFAYSIGGLLAETLMMTNHKGYFTNSKMGLFCSGPVFNRLTPVSRFIIDSEADLKLYKFIVEYLDSHLKNDDWLGHYLSSNHEEGLNFLSLLNYNNYSEYREEKLRKIANQVYAVALKKDTIIPFYEVRNTLQGTNLDIGIKVVIIDFKHKYSHEVPFPYNKEISEEVDLSFEDTFGQFAEFFSKK